MSSGTTNRYQVPTWRVLVVYGVMFAFIGAILFRLVNLQVVTGETWTNQAIDNYTLTINDPAPRGIIFDRNGYVLARNVASYNVVITPAVLPDDDEQLAREPLCFKKEKKSGENGQEQGACDPPEIADKSVDFGREEPGQVLECQGCRIDPD